MKRSEMTKGKRIVLLEEYIRLLEQEATTTHYMLLNYGYTCSDVDYERGEELRAQLKWTPLGEEDDKK